MTTPLSPTTAAFVAFRDGLGPYISWAAEQRKEYEMRFLALDQDDRHAVREERLEGLFAGPRGPVKEESVSPSGRYRLSVCPIATKEGSWSFTVGRVERVATGETVAEVFRNLDNFPFLWMEDHVDSEDWFVASEDYQGQSFVRLRDGRVFTWTPDAVVFGGGYCWIDMALLPDRKTLRADGCVWACPYEVRLYDVSDPAKGWPELACDEPLMPSQGSRGARLDVDGDGDLVWVEFERTFRATGEWEEDLDQRFYDLHREVHRLEATGQKGTPEHVAALERFGPVDAFRDDHDPKDHPEEWQEHSQRLIVFRRHPTEPRLEPGDEWISARRQEKERQAQEREAQGKADRQAWMQGCEIWQTLREHVGERLELLTGFVYPSLMSRWQGETNPVLLRVVARAFDSDARYRRSAEMEFGVFTGDLQVRCERRDGGASLITFPRSEPIAAWKRMWEWIEEDPA